jgi:hypothetical protein
MPWTETTCTHGHEAKLVGAPDCPEGWKRRTAPACDFGCAEGYGAPFLPAPEATSSTVGDGEAGS